MKNTVLLALFSTTQSKHLAHRSKLLVLDSITSTYNSWLTDDQYFHSSYTWTWSPFSEDSETIATYEERCEITPDDILEDSVFFRDTYYAVWNGLVKGFYHLEDPHPIDEQCMGDWMQDHIDYLTTVFQELEVFGLQTVSYERAMGAAMRSVDLIYNSKF